jgi:hypothetical protein
MPGRRGWLGLVGCLGCLVGVVSGATVATAWPPLPLEMGIRGGDSLGHGSYLIASFHGDQLAPEALSQAADPVWQQMWELFLWQMSMPLGPAVLPAEHPAHVSTIPPQAGPAVGNKAWEGKPICQQQT